MKQITIIGVMCILACNNVKPVPAKLVVLTERQRIHAYMDSVYMIPIKPFLAK